MGILDNTPAGRFALEVVGRLREAGFVAYLAGGCVRDWLLGLAAKDFDVATNARPDEVRAIFGRRRTIAIGASFGVITVLGPKPAGQIEVATFRSDGTYSDGRHPDQVVYSSPAADAQRRDFTINGMFYDPLNDSVIDYVGGQADLQARLVRAIGDPLQRISEDRLRMLRAVRFAATYAFEIEATTLTAIQQQHAQISAVSQERIANELERMLVHPNRRRAFELLAESQLLAEVIPEVTTIDDEQQWSNLPNVLEALEQPSFAVVLAAILRCTTTAASPKAVHACCRRLRLSNETRQATAWIIESEPRLRRADELRFSQLQPWLIHAQIESALCLAEAVVKSTGKGRDGIEHCRQKLGLPPAQLDPPPLIDGADLASFAKPGPAFAHALREVRAAQLDGLVTDKASAMKLARDRLKPS